MAQERTGVSQFYYPILFWTEQILELQVNEGNESALFYVFSLHYFQEFILVLRGYVWEYGEGVLTSISWTLKRINNYFSKTQPSRFGKVWIWAEQPSTLQGIPNLPPCTPTCNQANYSGLNFSFSIFHHVQ